MEEIKTRYCTRTLEETERFLMIASRLAQLHRQLALVSGHIHNALTDINPRRVDDPPRFSETENGQRIKQNLEYIDGAGDMALEVLAALTLDFVGDRGVKKKTEEQG